MAADSRTCPSCGAQVSAERERCELCGTPVEPSADPPGAPDADDSVPASGESAEAPSPSDADGNEEASGSAVFCNQCGWENPPAANYCSQCGTELQDLEDASPTGTRPVSADLPTGEAEETSSSDESEESPAPEDDEQLAMGRQIALVVGGALTVVLVLFFVTQWSSQYDWSEGASSESSSVQAGPGGGGPASSSGGGRPMRSSGQRGGGEAVDLQTLLEQNADSLSGSMAAQVDSLRGLIERATGPEKQKLQTELVNLLIGAGQPGRAAVIQKEIADATGSVDARRRTADLLYRWMQKLEKQGRRQQVSRVARHAAEAYATVAEKNPEDLDARTRMGEAYLLTNEPMRGIKAINAVLDDDSTFVPARFQKGLALLQINRLDQAVNQFEKVRQFADEGSPFYRQAGRALTVIEQQRSQSSTGGPAPGAGTSP